MLRLKEILSLNNNEFEKIIKQKTSKNLGKH